MESWSRVSGEVPSQRRPQISDILPDCILFVTVLAQFKLPQVRADFSRNAFRLPKRCNLSLDELDSLSGLVSPLWCGESLSCIRDKLASSLSVLDMMANRSPDYIQLGAGGVSMRPYEEWYEILHHLADSPYWKEVSNRECADEPVQTSSAKTNTDLIKTVSVGVSTPKVPLVDMSTQVESGVDTAVKSAAVCCTSGFKSEQPNGQSQISAPLSADRPTRVVSSPVLNETAVTPNSRFTSKTGGLPCGDVQGHHNVSPCSWCHRRGHQTDSCWRRRGLCLICGSPHQMRDCPRYIPPVPLVNPVCSSCGGAHLGKHCKRLLRRESCCHWCGRFGHSEESCWEKKGCCLICGSPDHMISRCPGFRHESMLPVFTPWCVKCGSCHAECSSYFV